MEYLYFVHKQIKVGMFNIPKGSVIKVNMQKKYIDVQTGQNCFYYDLHVMPDTQISYTAENVRGHVCSITLEMINDVLEGKLETTCPLSYWKTLLVKVI